MNNIMTINHPSWKHFVKLLEGKEGCNFRKDTKGEVKWKCKGMHNKDLAKNTLKKHFPGIDIKKSMEYFEKHGGHCDCEILFNVEDNARRLKKKTQFQTVPHEPVMKPNSMYFQAEAVKSVWGKK